MPSCLVRFGRAARLSPFATFRFEHVKMVSLGPPWLVEVHHVIRPASGKLISKFDAVPHA
jgi:hypothetical protein